MQEKVALEFEQNSNGLIPSSIQSEDKLQEVRASIEKHMQKYS